MFRRSNRFCNRPSQRPALLPGLAVVPSPFEAWRSASARESIVQRSSKTPSYVAVSLLALFETLQTIALGRTGFLHHLATPHFPVIRPMSVGTREVHQQGKWCIPV